MTASQEGSKAGASIEWRLDGWLRHRGATRDVPWLSQVGLVLRAWIGPPHLPRLNRRLRLAVERALALLPLLLDAALLAALRDGMDDGRQNGEHHGRDPAESERQRRGGRAGTP